MGARIAARVDRGAESLTAVVGFFPEEFTFGVGYRLKDFDERVTQIFMNLLYRYGDGHGKRNKISAKGSYWVA